MRAREGATHDTERITTDPQERLSFSGSRCFGWRARRLATHVWVGCVACQPGTRLTLLGDVRALPTLHGTSAAHGYACGSPVKCNNAGMSATCRAHARVPCSSIIRIHGMQHGTASSLLDENLLDVIMGLQMQQSAMSAAALAMPALPQAVGFC